MDQGSGFRVQGLGFKFSHLIISALCAPWFRVSGICVAILGVPGVGFGVSGS